MAVGFGAMRVHATDDRFFTAFLPPTRPPPPPPNEAGTYGRGCGDDVVATPTRARARVCLAYAPPNRTREVREKNHHRPPATRSRAFSKSLPTVRASRTLPPLGSSLAQSRPPPSRASVALTTRTRYVSSITSSPLQQCASEADPTVFSEPWYNRVTSSYMTPLQTG